VNGLHLSLLVPCGMQSSYTQGTVSNPGREANFEAPESMASEERELLLAHSLQRRSDIGHGAHLILPTDRRQLRSHK
jgi:hypothetical protein